MIFFLFWGVLRFQVESSKERRHNNPWGSHGLCSSLCIHCASDSSSFNLCQAQPLENTSSPQAGKKIQFVLCRRRPFLQEFSPREF